MATGMTGYPGTATDDPGSVAGPKRRLRGPLFVLLAGVAMGIAGFAGVIIRFVPSFTSPVIVVPGSVTRHLDGGRYAVYANTGTRSGGITSPSGFSPIRVEQVQIVGSDGTQLAVVRRTSFTTETISRNSAVYTAALEFRVARAGTYDLSFTGPPSQVIVARTIGDQLGRAGPWLALLCLGIVTGIVGLVLLIVRARRRSTQPVSAAGWPAGPYPGQPYPGQPYPGQPYPSQGLPGEAVPAGPPAGWYPDQKRPGGQRYWDGRQWTDHRA